MGMLRCWIRCYDVQSNIYVTVIEGSIWILGMYGTYTAPSAMQQADMEENAPSVIPEYLLNLSSYRQETW